MLEKCFSKVYLSCLFTVSFWSRPFVPATDPQCYHCTFGVPTFGKTITADGGFQKTSKTLIKINDQTFNIILVSNFFLNTNTENYHFE